MEQIQDPIWQQGYQAYEDGTDIKKNPYMQSTSENLIKWVDGWLVARKHYHHNMDILRGWYDQEEPINNK